MGRYLASDLRDRIRDLKLNVFIELIMRLEPKL